MSFMQRIKGEKDIIALCESFATEQNASYQKTNEAIEADEKAKGLGDDVFNPDDLFNTVDLPEEAPMQNGPSFSADEIELTHEEKESIKKELAKVLDEIVDKDSISDPALEMIVNEVANQNSYLNESEEANLEGPVEKSARRVGKAEAARKFMNELLGIAIENEGELPADVENLEGAPEGAEGAPEGTEGAPEGEAGLPAEGAPEGTEGTEGTELPPEGGDEPSKLNEGVDGTGEDNLENTPSTEGVVDEAVTTECGEGVVEVDPSEVIQVVDDNDPGVTPISEPSLGDAAPVVQGEEIPGVGGLDGAVSDETPLTVGVFKELVGKLLAEGVEGEKSFAELWKNLAGNPIVLSKPSAKGEQKTTDPKAKAPEGTTYESVKDESGNTNSLPKPSAKGEQKTTDPKAKAPEGTTYANPSVPKGGSAPSVSKPVIPKEEAANLVAATLNEGAGKKGAVSFLKEAAEAVKNAKKALNS